MLQGTKSRRCVRGEVKGTNLGRRAVDRPDEDHPHATVDLAAGLDADPLTEVAGERDVVDAVEEVGQFNGRAINIDLHQIEVGFVRVDDQLAALDSRCGTWART